MNCDEALETMQAELDCGRPGELPEPLRGHLAGCAPCRQLWEELCAVESGLGELARRDAVPTAGLHRKIMAALNRENEIAPVSARRRAFGSWQSLAAAAALIIGLGVFAWLAVRPPDPSNKIDPSTIALPTNLTLNVAAIDPTVVLGNPKQDLKEFAMSLLAMTDGVVDMLPPEARPTQATPSPHSM